ncbi:GbsR/MarR family transcriptional regulator [Paenibacillus antri]|uniref:HTH-type transcriptional regulator n=1 Tax=Paenibacillus antri TaxID=2582848 RepID=A0A5R9GB05_9BACL|nr:GbsR/MarR family transcriptional regulator [Paenibacillus antri]TLS51270.1 GbsR/MarR family transcriptional regulator [Paenibacillus antri]
MNKLQSLSNEHIAKIQSIRQRVIETIGSNMDLYGITLSIGHMYGHMYFQNEPVTLDEMGDVMGMSKTSMSTGMRTLIDLKMVHKVWGKGSRKDLYVVEHDWHQTFIDYFSVEWRKSIEMNISAINKALVEVRKLRREAEETQDGALSDVLDHDEKKLDEARKYYLWLGRLIDAFESGAIFELVPKEE